LESELQEADKQLVPSYIAHEEQQQVEGLHKNSSTSIKGATKQGPRVNSYISVNVWSAKTG
jgi:hypothetical protein